MNEIQESNSVAISDRNFDFTKTGLVIKGEPGFEQWGEMMEALKAMKSGVQWWWGDLANYGESKWGEKYSQFLDQRSYHTLANYAWVARQIPIEYRREELTFTHHQVVASLESLDKRAEMLDKAVQNNWPTSGLRERLKGQAMSCERCKYLISYESEKIPMSNSIENKALEYDVGNKGLKMCHKRLKVVSSFSSSKLRDLAQDCNFYEEDKDGPTSKYKSVDENGKGS